MKIAALALALTPFAAAAMAETAFPASGSCTQPHPVLKEVQEVAWSDGAATITSGRDRLEGDVVGMRRFGEGFKFSVTYTDPIMGRSEIVIMRPDANDEGYRMGRVHFDEIGDGEYLIGSIQGFAPAECSVTIAVEG